MQCPPRPSLILVCALALLAACNVPGYNSPAGYDLGKGDKKQLGKDLNEISGIAYNIEDSSLLAISDSKKKIFGILLKKMKLKDYTADIVPGNQDLEDIAIVDSVVYILSSKGQIYEVRSHGADTSDVRSYQLEKGDKNDFETLYYDSSARGLIMMCKACPSDNGLHYRSAYKFDLQTKSFDTTAFFNISSNEVRKLLKNDQAKFDPSAAAINPIDKHLYILSSAGNLMVIADTRGKVLAAYNLNPDDHPQAEGIAFAPNGDMYISNEGKYGKPTIQHFPYRAVVKK